jgi:hypothetical protein
VCFILLIPNHQTLGYLESESNMKNCGRFSNKNFYRNSVSVVSGRREMLTLQWDASSVHLKMFAESAIILDSQLEEIVSHTSLLKRSNQGSIPSWSMWDLWWTKWHWDMFFPRVLRFSPVSLIPPVLHYLEK